jgi:hypothetical protein
MGLGRWVCDSASHNNNNDYKYNYPDYDVNAYNDIGSHHNISSHNGDIPLELR